jgi:hypothetical protein
MKKPLIAAGVVAFLIAGPASADCVIGAKSKTQYQVLDSHTIMLSGGYGGQIILKSFQFFQPSSQVSVLKDSFCDFDNAVLYIDGEPVDIQQVKNID